MLQIATTANKLILTPEALSCIPEVKETIVIEKESASTNTTFTAESWTEYGGHMNTVGTLLQRNICSK